MPKSSYLEKHAFTDQLIDEQHSAKLGMVVVIPCYDEPNLLGSLQSLKNCELPKSDVEVIVVINSSEDESREVLEQNEKTFQEAIKWSKANDFQNFRFFILHQINLPRKHAGVGLARKIGMDEAIRRFNQVGVEDGVIACFDADSQCEENYLTQIEKHFQEHPETPACSIYFEHPVEGNEFANEVYEGIINYELHLRYYVNALKFAGYPYAHQTIGSSMAVRSSAYEKQGGMNRRKAGEDFYFLSKMMPLENFTELNSTKVIPSPRSSHRVPFGTGKAIEDWLRREESDYETYNPKIFKELKSLVTYLLESPNPSANLNDLPPSVLQFLEQNNFREKLREAEQNSASKSQLSKRLFQWFDNLKVLKYVHFARDIFYPNMEVSEASSVLFHEMEMETSEESKLDLLIRWREMDRK